MVKPGFDGNPMHRLWAGKLVCASREWYLAYFCEHPAWTGNSRIPSAEVWRSVRQEPISVH